MKAQKQLTSAQARLKALKIKFIYIVAYNLMMGKNSEMYIESQLELAQHGCAPRTAVFKVPQGKKWVWKTFDTLPQITRDAMAKFLPPVKEVLEPTPTPVKVVKPKYGIAKIDLSKYQLLEKGAEIQIGDVINSVNSMSNKWYEIMAVTKTQAIFMYNEVAKGRLKRTYEGEYAKTVGSTRWTLTQNIVYRRNTK